MDNFRNEIELEIKRLSDKSKVIFTVLTCETLYPNYVYFSTKVNWGDPSVLRRGMDLLYKYLETDFCDFSAVNSVLKEINDVTPDTEDFPGILVSFALDASSSIQNALTFLIDNNYENIVDVATYARDTVDMFIQEVGMSNASDSNIETLIEQNSFMIREKARQRVLIDILAKTNPNTITDRMLKELGVPLPIIDIQLFNE